MSDIIKPGNIENKIIEIRDQQVILDFDVAELYGVVTKRVIEAIKNNPEKKALIKKVKEQDKKILKIHNVKFSEKDKQNLLAFLE